MKPIEHSDIRENFAIYVSWNDVDVIVKVDVWNGLSKFDCHVDVRSLEQVVEALTHKCTQTDALRQSTNIEGSKSIYISIEAIVCSSIKLKLKESQLY